jgi:hypothetical protein
MSIWSSTGPNDDPLDRIPDRDYYTGDIEGERQFHIWVHTAKSWHDLIRFNLDTEGAGMECLLTPVEARLVIDRLQEALSRINPVTCDGTDRA